MNRGHENFTSNGRVPFSHGLTLPGRSQPAVRPGRSSPSGEQAVDTGTIEAGWATGSGEASQAPIGVAAEGAPDAEPTIEHGRRIGKVKDPASGISAEIHPRCLGDIDPVVRVALDDVVGDLGMGALLNGDPVPPIFLDRVSNDASIRGPEHRDPITTVILDEIGTGCRIIARGKSDARR